MSNTVMVVIAVCVVVAVVVALLLNRRVRARTKAGEIVVGAETNQEIRAAKKSKVHRVEQVGPGDKKIAATDESEILDVKQRDAKSKRP